METNKLKPVNVCIYCFDTDISNLTDEHIVPFCLNGNLILPKSSCKNCQKIINGIESKIAKFYGTIRLRENMQTRNANKIPKTITLMSYNGEIQLSKFHMWGVALHIKFKPPRILFNDDSNCNWIGTKLDVINYANPNLELINKIYGVTSLTYKTPNPDFDLIAKQIAKIAHAYAVSIFGLDNITYYLPELILKKESSELCKYVGSVDETRPANNSFHELKYEVINHNGKKYIVVIVRLFSFTGSPDFQVVVGEFD
jgi:hypothetical protein